MKSTVIGLTRCKLCKKLRQNNNFCYMEFTYQNPGEGICTSGTTICNVCRKKMHLTMFRKSLRMQIINTKGKEAKIR